MSAGVHATRVEEYLARYRTGFFPFQDPWTGAFCWARYRVRAIIPLDDAVVARVRKVGQRALGKFEIVRDRHFDEIMEHLTGGEIYPDTWVIPEVVAIYRALREAGRLVTVEAIRDGRLAGALVGVDLGRVFVAETMYHLESDASKACLCQVLLDCRSRGYAFVDVQMPHEPDHPSTRLGEIVISHEEFLRKMAAALQSLA
ncbi:MAG: hypothetical protein KC466_19395 [Myxococcales bacterium]|nr:hypothetical protein [Myxococcales bacterium]